MFILVNYAFGLNSNILETNLINIVLVGSLIFYVVKNFFQLTIEKRRKDILQTLNTLDENLVIANQKFLEANKQLRQINIVLKNLFESNAEQKFSFLTKTYSNLVFETNNLFNFSLEAIETISYETFQFLQKYLITLVLGKILIEVAFFVDDYDDMDLLDSKILEYEENLLEISLSELA